MKLKIFLDSADETEVLKHLKDIQGLTTNPSLMKKAGVTNYEQHCKQLLKHLENRPASFEIFADQIDEMKQQALYIASWGPQVYVKIPISNTQGVSTLPLIRELSHQGVQFNVTALFTSEQILQTCLALKGGAPSLVSIFVGRISDLGKNPIPTICFATQLAKSLDSQIKILWASTREVYHLFEAEATGCHVITVPPNILAKRSLCKKDLNVASLETIQQFYQDAISAGFTL